MNMDKKEEKEIKTPSFLDRLINLGFEPEKKIILVLLILGILLRIIAANNIGTHPDDINHAVFSYKMFDSNKLAVWCQSTALWYYIQSIFLNIVGISMLGSRFASILYGTGLILITYLFAMKITKSRTASAISASLIAFSPLLIKNTLPEMDVAVSFFLVLSVYLFFLFIETKNRTYLLLLAASMGVGIMIKLYFAFFALAIIFLIVLLSIKDCKNNKVVIDILFFGLLIIGILVFLMPYLVSNVMISIIVMIIGISGMLYFYSNRNAQEKKNLMNIYIITGIVFLFSLAPFAHNYFLYKDKQILDFIFSNTFGAGIEKSSQYYSWAAGWNMKPDYRGFFFGNQINFPGDSTPGFLLVLKELVFAEPLLMIFGIIGLGYYFKKNRLFFYLLLLTILPAYTYLGAFIPMLKHFIWVPALLAIPAGAIIDKSLLKIKKNNLRIIILLILLFSLFYLSTPIVNPHFYGKSAYNKLTDYVHKAIPNDALIVTDSRIYRGNLHWAFLEKNYVEASQFFQIAQQLNSQGGARKVEVYYVECVIDDCGWGTVKDQPEFNESMEQVTTWFANQSTYEKNFDGPIISERFYPFSDNKQIEYTVYKTTLALNPAILSVVKRGQVWFLYPVGYDRAISEIYDDYEIKSPIDSLINLFTWATLYIEIILAFFLLGYVFYRWIYENESKYNNSGI
jgi:4-amino-4-deoxy-L-arabinose transferase-like glycosyltransferase